MRDLSHFTISVSDAARSNKFYQDLFGFSIRSYQGPTAPTLAVGPGVQFLMFTGGGGGGRGAAPPAPPRPASINHVCMNMDGFNVERIQKALESYGIKPREQRDRAGAADAALRQHADGESRRRQGGHARAVLHRSRTAF